VERVPRGYGVAGELSYCDSHNHWRPLHSYVTALSCSMLTCSTRLFFNGSVLVQKYKKEPKTRCRGG
jgi:hypothetical protein